METTKFKFTVCIRHEGQDNKEFIDNDVWLTREEFYDLIKQFRDKKS